MNKAYVLAIDGGTGSVRAVLFDNLGYEVAVASSEWYHDSDPRYPGSMDFNCNRNWVLVQRCIREVLTKSQVNAQDIRAVSAASMREGIVLYDRQGNEIWACANVDARADREVAILNTQDNKIEATAYSASGQTFSLGAVPRLLWLKEHEPDIYHQASSMTMLNDWILYKLCGVLQVDPSNACTTGIFSLHDRSWDPAIAEICGVRTDIYPIVNEAGTILGNVSRKASDDTGLSTATLVISGGGDAQMASVGVGSVRPGQVFVSGGSFWQQNVNINHIVMDPERRIRVNCHAVENLWQLETIVFFPGIITRWFRDAFCAEEVALAQQTGKDPYQLLEEKAKDIPPGSYGIMPIFSDTMNYSKWRHAAPSFLNLSLDPSQTNKYSMFRSIQENTCLVTLGNLQLIQQVTGEFPTEVTFAGGASKGLLWSQILADVLGVSVRIPVVKEAASLGTAMFALVGSGIYQDVSTASEQLVRWERTHQPNLENTKIYRQVYDRWLPIYQEQLKLADQGLTSHMWKAPGI